jgi:hypothetical protein
MLVSLELVRLLFVLLINVCKFPVGIFDDFPVVSGAVGGLSSKDCVGAMYLVVLIRHVHDFTLAPPGMSDDVRRRLWYLFNNTVFDGKAKCCDSDAVIKLRYRSHTHVCRRYRERFQRPQLTRLNICDLNLKSDNCWR